MVRCINIPCASLPLNCSLPPRLGPALGGRGGVGMGGMQECTCTVHTDKAFIWYPLPLIC